MVAKLTLAFLAGMLADVAFLWFADGRPTPAAFAIGFICALGLIAVLGLSSPPRILRASRVLNALGEALDKPARRAKREPEAAPTPVAAVVAPEPEPADPRVEELASVLRHLGTSKKIAEASARQAIAAEPTGSFQSLFKLAVTAAKVAA